MPKISSKRRTNKEKKAQKAAWVAWCKKESQRKKAIKQLPRGVIGVFKLYKEYTPPSFIEPSKEPIKQKPLVTLIIDLREPPLYSTPQTPINYPIRTSFAKPELQEQEQQPGQEMEESEEEDFLRLDIEGEFGYSSTSSESECSLNSSISDEEDYYVL
ncbi:hypothetical protein B7463_g8791, partial [Scytalidium lignicola]